MEGVATVKAYLDLCRVSNLPTVWTNVLAASLLADAAAPPGWIFLLALSLSCLYLAGMALNDLCDLKYDREHRRWRPLPSGRVTLRGAVACTSALAAAALGIVALAPHRAALGGALALCAAIAGYDLHHKKNSFSVLIMGYCRFLVFVTTSLALCGGLPQRVMLAGGCQFLYVVILTVVARCESARGGFSFPVIPLMLAAISLLDALFLGILVSPLWAAPAVTGFCLTVAGQRFVRGD